VKTENVDIFEYDNYRAFLRDLYEQLKATKPHFSYRYFSLRMDQARTAEERKCHAENLMRFRPFRRIHPIRKDPYDYYAHWYNVAVREMVSLPAFREDPDWIARAVRPPLSPGQVRKALERMVALGLVRRHESGRLVQADAFVTTGDEVTSASVAQYHREMLRRASEAIDRFPPGERDISSVTLALSEERFAQVEEIVQRFRKELLAVADQDPSPEGVFQVNLQLFPLTRILKRSE